MKKVERKTIYNEVKELFYQNNTLKFSFESVSKKYDLSFASVKKTYYSFNPSPEKPHGNSKLSFYKKPS